MKILNKLKSLFMAKIELRKFIPTPEEQQRGAVPMDAAEIVEALAKYKAKNPVKYEAKKAALFARYGLNLEDEVTTEDANDLELKEIAKKVSKKATK